MKFLATLAFASLVALSLDIGAAVASHFQYATMSSTPVGPVDVTAPVDSFQVKINLRIGVRRNGNYATPPGLGSFPGGCDALADPGDVIWDNQGPTYINFGDGTFSSLTAAMRFRVTSFDCAPGAEHNFLVADALNPGNDNQVGILKTYVGPGPFTAKLSTFPGSGDPCCRIGQFPQLGFPCLNNRSEGFYPVQTTISPQSGNSSPVTSMPVRLTVPRGVASTFQVPGVDPNGDPIQWRLSTDAEAGGGSHPPNLSIDSGTGLVTWDNSLLDATCAWTTQVMVEDLDGATVKSKAPVDFLLFVCDGSPSAPVFAACAAPVTITACQPYSFALAASDADTGAVSLAVSGLPVGATMTPALPTSGNPVASTFSWTPTGAQVGTHVISFSASDGCNTTLCTRTITVVANTAKPVFTNACSVTETVPPCKPHSFAVSVGDATVGDNVTLTVTGLPAGATMTPALPTSGNPAASTFNWTPTATQVGTFVMTFTATDGAGCNTTVCTRTVKVQNTPPDVSAAVANPATLFPANHKMRAVSVEGVTDADGHPVTLTLTGIKQDEQRNTQGDGNTCPDGLIVDNQASVRAERVDGGNGRVYVISFTANDGCGGVTAGTVSVCVPIIEAAGETCVNDGATLFSEGPCTKGNSITPETIIPTELSLTVGRVTGAQAMLEFTLPQDTQVDLSVFDVAGRRLATIESGSLTAGVYQRAWDMGNATNGLYFVRLRAGGVTLNKTVAKIE